MSMVTYFKLATQLAVLEFHDRPSYFGWRKAWRENMALLVVDIRKARQAMHVTGGDPIAQRNRAKGRKVARLLLETRKASKEKAGKERAAALRLLTGPEGKLVRLREAEAALVADRPNV